MKIQSVNSQSFGQKNLNKKPIPQVTIGGIYSASSQSTSANSMSAVDLKGLVQDEKSKIAKYRRLFTPLTQFEFAVEDFAGKIIDMFTRTRK